MLCAWVTPPQPTASAATKTKSQTEAKAVREYRRKPPLADTALRLIDPIPGTMKCHGPRRKVDHGVRGTRIAVAWLPDAARVQERARREGIGRVVTDTARLLFLPAAEERRYVRVASAAVRRLRDGERCGGARRICYVLPERVAEAPVAERHVARLERARERRKHVALLGGEPPLMHLRRGGRRGIE